MRLGQRKESVTRRVVAAGRPSLEPQGTTRHLPLHRRSSLDVDGLELGGEGHQARQRSG